jgi:hypothetical protein
MKTFKTISNYLKAAFIGVLIGQYCAPIPLVVKDSALPQSNGITLSSGAYSDQYDESSQEIASLIKEMGNE